MTKAIEGFQSGTAQFNTFGGTGSISSTQAGTITTGGTNRLIVWVFGTGRSKAPGDTASATVNTVTASGLTPTRIFSKTFNFTFPFADGSFPNDCQAYDVWVAPAASALTGLAWSTTTDDGFINNQFAAVFAISGLADINAVDYTSIFVAEELTSSSSHPEVGHVTTNGEAVVLAFISALNSGFTFGAESGYTLTQASANGHGTSNHKYALYRAVEASAITDKALGDASGSTNFWSGFVLGIGSTSPAGANLITSLSAEVLHTGLPAARITAAAAEVLHTGAPAARVTALGIEVLRSIADTTVIDGNASGSTITVTSSLSAGAGDAYVPVPGQTLTVTSSLPTVGVPTAQAIDGSPIYEVILGIEASTIYQTSDYDSIWGRGERVVNGLIDVGFYGFDTVGFWESAFNDAYSIGPGDGPTVSGTFNAGDALWFEFNGGQKIDLRGFKLVGNENIATDWFFKFVGGLSAGVIETDAYGKEFDTASRQQGPNNDPLTASLVSSEYPTTPRIFVPHSHYEFVYDSGTQSTNRFCNEIWLKVAHSNLDGGDRRLTNGQLAKQVAFTMSSHWASAGNPQDLLFDGIPRLPGISKSVATLGDAANSSNPVSTVGAWLQFVFPRPVIMNHFMFVSHGNAEVYTSGLPTKYGKWHWEYSLDSGATWTAIGSPWSFSEDVHYMVAPRDGSQFALGPIGTDGKGASHWRMVLDQGPVLGSGNSLWQIMFDLIDVTGQAPPLTIAFSDDIDGVPATPTIGGPGSPYVIGFTDGTDDKLTAAVSNTPNAVLEIAFDDGATFDTWADIFPSVVVQSFVIATGRV